MQYIKKIIPVALVMFILISCSDSKLSAEEQSRLSEMDSTEKTIEQRTKELEEQTKKVEASLEKLDEEFTTTKND